MKDLFGCIKIKLCLKIKINRNSSFQCDRSLNCSKFEEKTKIQIPSWKEMIDNLYNDINKGES